MALASTVSALPARSQSPMPKHSGLRSMTPSRLTSRKSQALKDERPKSLVRGRSEYQGGRATAAAVAAPTAEVDCFATLGLTPTASAMEIRQAYRSLAKKYHPDANPLEATSKFVDLRSAYEMCLSRTQSNPSPAVARKTRRSSASSTPASMNSSPARPTRRSAVRRDAWDDIWDEMLSSPKASRRRL